MVDYYKKLLNLVNKGQLIIRFIIAPTRSGSTLLEESLSMSQDIDYKCHEPLLLYNYVGPSINPLGYKIIYERIGGKDFEKSSQIRTILIKEINFWLYSYGEYKKLFALGKDPILFLIRNPLLTMESRMKKIAETLPLNTDISTKNAILYLCKEKDRDELSDQQVFDLYSKKQGFTSWNNLLDYSFKKHKYNLIGKILEISKAWFNVEAWGSVSIEAEIAYLNNLNREVILIDSSEFRLCPEVVIQTICHAWSIRYNNLMIYWGKGGLHLDSVANSIWFERVAKSDGVQPPIEIPLVLKEFPDFIQKQLKQNDIPAYIRLMKSSAMININGINSIEFDLPIYDGDHKRFHKLGVINGVKNKHVHITIRDVDPVFAISREPELVTNPSYLQQKKAYKDIIKIISHRE